MPAHLLIPHSAAVGKTKTTEFAYAATGLNDARGTPRAVGETVILLHPPLPLVGVSIAMERERQQNDCPGATARYTREPT